MLVKIAFPVLDLKNATTKMKNTGIKKIGDF